MIKGLYLNKLKSWLSGFTSLFSSQKAYYSHQPKEKISSNMFDSNSQNSTWLSISRLILRFLKSAVITFNLIMFTLYAAYWNQFLDLDTQLVPMAQIGLCVSILVGLIQVARYVPVNYELELPSNSILMPARVVPSNSSRKKNR